MSVEKNITMRQFNGVDYDTLYPKTKIEQVEGAYTQQQILADSTKTLYGLESTATPDDLFQKLILPNGKFGFKIIFKFANGSVVSGFAFNEDTLHPLANQSLVTDSNGIVFCYADSQSVSATFGTDYFGIVEQTVQLTADTTKPFTPVTIVLQNDTSLTSMFILDTSKTYKLIGNIDEVDMCAVGGGGGGRSNGAGYNGYGGGGGYATNLMNYKFSSSASSFAVSIGSGGGNGGGNGGKTSCMVDGVQVVAAEGGHGASSDSVGNGNGSRSSGKAGGDGTVRVFNDSRLPLPGGGGGLGNASGGKDFGGHGSYSAGQGVTGGVAPSGPGGGGGGQDTGDYYGNGSTAGHAGAVYVRVRYK